MEKDLIVGIHSITETLKNSNRTGKVLYYTEDGAKKLQSVSGIQIQKLEDVELHALEKHSFQERAKGFFNDIDFEYSRVPSGLMLKVDKLLTMEPVELYEFTKSKDTIRILCFDGISDVHNAGALTRTANFYGVDIILTSGKKSFGFSPSFFRISSGAVEHLRWAHVQSLPKTLVKLQSLGIKIIGLSEHAKNPLDEDERKKSCLILGSEEKGISHAILRVCESIVSLESQGETKSLNVSVAGAVAMERIFSS